MNKLFITICRLTALSALQGAARMVLQGNIHPSQIKDAVTSTLFSHFPPHLSPLELPSLQPPVDVQLRVCSLWKTEG